MVISRSSAEAAVNVLKSLGGSALGTLMSSNQHLFEKHLTKAKAKAAAGGQPQGYFERVSTHEFVNSGQFKELQVSEKRKAKWLETKDIASINKNTAKKVKGSMTVTNEIGAGDIGSLLISSFSSSDFRLCESSDQVDTRFRFATRIPAGYEGREVDRHGNKDKAVEWVVIVVAAAQTTNVQLITIFPAKEAYVNGLTALT